MGWVIGLSSLYASEAEDRPVVMNAVVDTSHRQPDQKGKSMNLPSNWMPSASGRPLFSVTA